MVAEEVDEYFSMRRHANEFTREQRGRKEDVCSGAHMSIWKGKRTPPSSLSESSWDNQSQLMVLVLVETIMS
ncbi:unnamed protein product [Aspergillus oryzae]|nr:unnamed protein product [Aspergillus oryzae]GMF90016.1 unnamed protein product [Aspergillus oryzae]GMG10893.1 unnamed protein product [Aspergillus oryzae]